jgi:DNA polymerase III epsilon subunit-like protein
MNRNDLHLFFDTETSGFINKAKSFDDPTQNWCCQIGAILSTKDEIIDQLDVIIKANGRTMPSFVAKIHGITAERADQEGVEEYQALEQFAMLLADMPMKICHNYNFDSEFLDHLFKRNLDNLTDIARSKYFLDLPHFCTMNNKDIIAFCDLKNKKGAPKKPKLEELYEILFLEPMPNAHNAMADATATMECFYELQTLGVI